MPLIDRKASRALFLPLGLRDLLSVPVTGRTLCPLFSTVSRRPAPGFCRPLAELSIFP